MLRLRSEVASLPHCCALHDRDTLLFQRTSPEGEEVKIPSLSRSARRAGTRQAALGDGYFALLVDWLASSCMWTCLKCSENIPCMRAREDSVSRLNENVTPSHDEQRPLKMGSVSSDRITRCGLFIILPSCASSSLICSSRSSLFRYWVRSSEVAASPRRQYNSLAMWMASISRDKAATLALVVSSGSRAYAPLSALATSAKEPNCGELYSRSQAGG